jgi:hypothetical protein
VSLESRRFVRGGADVTLDVDAGVMLRISGSLREANVGEWLMPLIDQIHADSMAAGTSEVIVDIRHLVYANAAMWTCLVGWLRILRRDKQARYNLRIRSEPGYRWQQVGIPMLVVFGADRLIVEQ